MFKAIATDRTTIVLSCQGMNPMEDGVLNRHSTPTLRRLITTVTRSLLAPYHSHQLIPDADNPTLQSPEQPKKQSIPDATPRQIPW